MASCCEGMALKYDQAMRRRLRQGCSHTWLKENDSGSRIHQSLVPGSILPVPDVVLAQVMATQEFNQQHVQG